MHTTSERNQPEKPTQYMTPMIRHSGKGKTVRQVLKTSGCRRRKGKEE